MKKVCLLLPLVCSIPALLSCSTPVQHAKSTMRIEPVLSIRGSDKTARGFYQLGRYYQGQNRFEQAADAYRNALLLDANYIDAHSALGTIYSTQGKFDEAIAEFTSILKMAPELAHIYNNLGYTYYLQGNQAEAVAAFEKAIALEPRNPRVFNNLGAAYQKLGDAEKSRLAFSHAAELNSSTSETMALAADATPNKNAPLPALSTTSVRLEPAVPAASVTLDSGSGNLAAAGMRSKAVMLAATSIALHAADYRDSIADASSQGNASALRIDPVLSKLFPTSAPADDRALKQGKAFRFEIANGDGVTGLARKVGDTLARHGLPKPQLTNLKPYQQRLTVIQYRDGFHDEAVRLSSKLLKPPVLLNNNALCKNSDVRLVLGKDVVSQMALFGQDGEAVRLAYRDRDAERTLESAVR